MKSFWDWMIFNMSEKLTTLRPELIAEWHPLKNGLLKPLDVAPYSHKKCWWVCPQGHEYLAIVEHRTKGSGCPYCSNHKILSGFNDLATLRPDVLREWAWDLNTDVLPNLIAQQSSKVVWWRCEHGHEYKMKVAIKVGNGYGCPICSGKRVLEGYNDLASQRPDLAEQWDMDRNGLLTPQLVTCGSHKKVWWLCEREHSWSMPVRNRTTQNQGCPFCSGKKVWPGFNDFATRHPELV